MRSQVPGILMAGISSYYNSGFSRYREPNYATLGGYRGKSYARSVHI